MKPWTNDNTGHNRTIDTGPTPSGKPERLLITLDYVETNLTGNLHKAIALDGHVIPLILRVPEMRDTLQECVKWIEELQSRYDGSNQWARDELYRLLIKIESLTAPTREELDALK